MELSNKNHSVTTFVILAFLIGTVIGFSLGLVDNNISEEKDLKITDMVISSRVVGDTNPETYIYSYTIVLYNYGDKGLYVDSVRPVFNKEFYEQLVLKNTELVVNEMINADSAIEIHGQIELNATKYSEKDFGNFEITSFVTEVGTPSTRVLKAQEAMDSQ